MGFQVVLKQTNECDPLSSTSCFVVPEVDRWYMHRDFKEFLHSTSRTLRLLSHPGRDQIMVGRSWIRLLFKAQLLGLHHDTSDEVVRLGIIWGAFLEIIAHRLNRHKRPIYLPSLIWELMKDFTRQSFLSREK